MVSYGRSQTPAQQLRSAADDIVEALEASDSLRARIGELSQVWGGGPFVDEQRENISIEILGAVNAGDRAATTASRICGRLRGADREQLRLHKTRLERELEQLRSADATEDPLEIIDGLVSIADSLEELQLVERSIAEKLQLSPGVGF